MIKLSARNTKGDLIFLEIYPDQESMIKRAWALSKIFTGLEFNFKKIYE